MVLIANNLSTDIVGCFTSNRLFGKIDHRIFLFPRSKKPIARLMNKLFLNRKSIIKIITLIKLLQLDRFFSIKIL